MTQFKNAWREHQRRRCMRPDAYRYIRHDAWRFMPPGSPRYLGRDVVKYFWPDPEDNQALDVRPRSYQRKYAPGQPRVPAGNSDGGQWTSEDGNGVAKPSIGTARNDSGVLSDVTPDNFFAPGTQLAQNDRSTAYPIDLYEEERLGGHTIEKHVNRSPETLIAQAREAFLTSSNAQDSRSGSFSSLAAATKLVNSTLAQNQVIVDEVASGLRESAVLSAEFGSVTGIEAVAPYIHSQPYVRQTYGVGVVIIHDRSSRKGYTVWTAFPNNR